MAILNKQTICNNNDYFFTDQELIQLLSFLDSYYEIKSIKVKKINDLEQVLDKISDLTQIDNFKSRKIVSITIVAFSRIKNEENPNFTSLYFSLKNSKSNYDSSVNITYEWYDDKDGFAITDFINSFLEKKKRNFFYSFYNKYSNILGTISYILLFLWFLIISIYYKKPTELDIEHLAIPVMIGLLICNVIFNLKSWFMNNLTPKVVFYFGEEIEAENNRRSIRDKIFWGLLFSVILPIVLNYLI